MPDVCLSPPSPPAGPIPIPYPNTSKADKTNQGSKTVKVGGDEVGLKNSSTYKDSQGDEAATKSLGMGVVTHTIQGMLKHSAWSFNVKIEGENAIRHMDLTTHNHINNPNIAITLNKAQLKPPRRKNLTCKELEQANSDARNYDLKSSKPTRTKVRSRKSYMRAGKKVWRRIVKSKTVTLMRSAASYTVTTAVYVPTSGRPVVMKAVSDQGWVKSSKKDGYAQSRSGNQKMACTNKKWKTKGEHGKRKANHTEPKLIEQIFDAARANKIPMPAAPGSLGKLRMSIHWKSGGEVRPDPCPNCQKGVCAAVACGLEITLCQDGEETPAPCKDGKWVGE
jgi:hypothetical protein